MSKSEQEDRSVLEAKEFMERFCLHMQNLTTATLQQAHFAARQVQSQQELVQAMNCMSSQLHESMARMDYLEVQISQLKDQLARLARVLEDPDSSRSQASPGPLRWPEYPAMHQIPYHAPPDFGNGSIHGGRGRTH